jgi:hypothetical protein
MSFLAMSEQEAARIADLTVGASARLEPRRVEAGPHTGKYVLPRRVMFDPAFTSYQDAFALMQELSFDTEIAWPPVAEE